MPSHPTFFLQPAADEIVILGWTKTGTRFRPGDWSERLCGIVSVFGPEHRLRYSPYVRPTSVDGTSCVVVVRTLQQLEPRLFNFLMQFAYDNELIALRCEDALASLVAPSAALAAL